MFPNLAFELLVAAHLTELDRCRAPASLPQPRWVAAVPDAEARRLLTRALVRDRLARMPGGPMPTGRAGPVG